MAGRTLITGGAGFIGSHLAARLKAMGREVILLDNLSTGSRANIDALLDDQCTLIEGGVGEVLHEHPQILDEVTHIYHLAASVGVRLVVEQPIETIRNNIEESAVILDAAQHCGATILVASTSEVYGKSKDVPFSEGQDIITGPTTSPRWSYALSKAIDEHIALAYHHQRGLNVVVVRFFNAIGHRQIGRYGMVVPRFVNWAVNGEDLVIHGDGSQTRSFCDARDTTRACVELMENPALHGQVYNVGSDREISISQLADLVIERAGSKSKKVFIPYEQAYDKNFEDMVRRVPDISKLRAAIGFEPEFALEKTIDELIEVARKA